MKKIQWPIFPDLHRLHQVKLILFLVKNRQNFHQPILVYGPIIHEHNLVQVNDQVHLDGAYIVLFEIHDKQDWQENHVQSIGQPLVLL